MFPQAQAPAEERRADAAAPQRGAQLVTEAEAQNALAELFPHLKLDALRAIQELFPLARRRPGA